MVYRCFLLSRRVCWAGFVSLGASIFNLLNKPLANLIRPLFLVIKWAPNAGHPACNVEKTEREGHKDTRPE